MKHRSLTSDHAGRELSRGFFTEIVRPLLMEHFPGMAYAAGRLGSGSDVLGLDDATSRDHDWGARLSLFVPADQVDAVDAELERTLPARFHDAPTRFAFTGDTVPRHHVEVSDVRDFLDARLGFDPRATPSPRDWLSLTGQVALEITGGPVFADDTGDLTAARAALTWYPDDLWRYVVAADWHRLDQELPLMGRAGDVGDERGSRIIAARLAHITTHLAFTINRRWTPYAKWIGTLFRDLPDADALGAAIDHSLSADTWQQRQAALADALEIVRKRQSALGLTTADQATVSFWTRPYLQPNPDIMAQLLSAVADPDVQALPRGRGSAEQRTDVVDILVSVTERRRLVAD